MDELNEATGTNEATNTYEAAEILASIEVTEPGGPIGASATVDPTERIKPGEFADDDEGDLEADEEGEEEDEESDFEL